MFAKKKPANATWIAKTKVRVTDPSIDYPPEPGSAHVMPEVEVAWYEGHRLKLTLAGAAPAVISQAYLPGQGQDVIIELRGTGGPGLEPG
jgi:hypothetical protein